ncbi:EntS/YbdA MFS transporter [Escherichia coli H588]|nr:EntS/YbdA MFS transporter [Escherichia coli H588]
MNNNGNTTVDGRDSTGTEINGDKAIVNNDGDSTILDGGTEPALRVMMRRPTTAAIPP